MAFVSGKSGNPAGRKKGSPNKVTAALRERIEQVLLDLDTTLADDLRALQPEQRVALWAKLQEYLRPKLSRTALVGPQDGKDHNAVQIEIIGAVRPPTTSERDIPQ